MNVNDFDMDVVPTDFSEKDRLDWIFAKQHSLAEKYIPIEIKNGLCYSPDIPVDINTGKGQARLKDFFWRTTEELIEARSADIEHKHLPVHTIEELIDALHFLVETFQLAGITSREVCFGKAQPKQHPLLDDKRDKLDWLVAFAPVYTTLDEGMMAVITAMGRASNCLKQKPWKQTHILTDEKKFYAELEASFIAIIGLLVKCKCKTDDIFTFYFKKAAVNNFRQESNY